ncbi:hypothetical protein CPAV1605_732 [seawater metagenome]|uniref:Uncharacterized protein n=1 Tax=seawater metagenome TaxID=1561972 RepID=A0A5E8CIT5_9ZZZZ
MKILNKYKVLYQYGGKKLDMLFYRILNSFLEEKPTILNIINSFENGIEIGELPVLYQKLEEINIDGESIRNLKDILDKIITLPFMNPLEYTSVFLSSFDEFFFKQKESLLSDGEINEIITKVPNVLELESFNDYLNYLLNHRYENYFNQDLRRYIRDTIYKRIRDSFATTDAATAEFNRILTIFNTKYKNISSVYKSIRTYNSSIKKILDNIMIVNGMLENKSGIYEFKLLKSINIDLLSSITHPCLINLDNLTVIHKITFINITDSIIKFKLINGILNTSNSELSIGFTDFDNAKILKNRYDLAIESEKRIPIMVDEMQRIDSLAPFFNHNIIQNGDKTISTSYFEILDEMNKELYKYVNKAGKRGESFEKQTLFIFAIKFCLDHPEIDINSIRIFTSLTIILEEEDRRWQVGELDVLIVNENNEIIGIGEMKTSIDTIQTAYKQVKKIQEAFFNISKLKFYKNKTEYLKFTLSLNIKSLLESFSDTPENNPYFYIVTLTNNLSDIDPAYVTNLLTYLNSNNIIKLENDKFILNPEANPALIKKAYTDLLENMHQKDIELTSQILMKYLGKNNLLIFRKIDLLVNAAKIISKHILKIE